MLLESTAAAAASKNSGSKSDDADKGKGEGQQQNSSSPSSSSSPPSLLGSALVSERHAYKYRCSQCSLAFKTAEKLALHSQYHVIRDATRCRLCSREDWVQCCWFHHRYRARVLLTSILFAKQFYGNHGLYPN